MVKVLISYDMQQGKEQECQEYLVNKLAPGLARMGFQFSDVWYTVWGSAPEITGGGEVESLEKARTIFGSSTWEKLLEGMEPLISNFQVRVVRGQLDAD
ncbi:MAG: hypothetical protein H3C34_09275 [Caldilineaceae bacterium]|nr:hypothetical protein [Caldilineaceae bacterium]